MPHSEVRIRRQDGSEFSIRPVQAKGSPLDVPGVETDVPREEILAAIHESRRLDGQVELRVTSGGILIERASKPRAGWGDAARMARERAEDGLLDEPVPTEFDEAEWNW